jgi:hypothetical protein
VRPMTGISIFKARATTVRAGSVEEDNAVTYLWLESTIFVTKTVTVLVQTEQGPCSRAASRD